MNVELTRIFIFRNVSSSICPPLRLVNRSRRTQIYGNRYRLWRMLVSLQQACSTEEYWCCDNMDIEAFTVTF
jgi:hypothetical protein